MAKALARARVCTAFGRKGQLRRALSSSIPGFAGDCSQTSRGPMWQHQASLPRLPIPDLELSCSRYLSAVAPLSAVSEAQLRSTELAVAEFLAVDGAKLNRELHARDAANAHTSYINPFWDDMYLEGRWRTMIDSNPGGAMASAAFEKRGINGQVPRAARLVANRVCVLPHVNCTLTAFCRMSVLFFCNYSSTQLHSTALIASNCTYLH